MNPDEAVATVVLLFAERGEDAYLGEPVTQLQHALQAALLAESEDAEPDLVAAALLHDVGHLLDEPTLAVGAAYLDGDDREHEEIGARWLRERFSPKIADCARLHVGAKRYLCAVDLSYLARLSPASVRSLSQQGGPMTQDEIAAFESEPHFELALLVRRWDDRAKDPARATPTIDYFLPALEAAVARV